MGFAADVQRSLEYIKQNPHRSAVYPDEIPKHLVVRLKRYLVNSIIQNAGRINSQNLDKFNQRDGVPHELENLYLDLVRAGLENEDDIEKILDWFIDSEILKICEGISLPRGLQMIVEFAKQTRHHYYDQEDYGLLYALVNHLCHYGDGQWSLTGLGRAVLNMPELQATHFLIALEVYLYSSPDEYHISPELLHELFEKGVYPPHMDTDQTYYFFLFYEEHLSRLEAFGVARMDLDNAPSRVFTKVGKLIVESVLSRDSGFEALFPLYIREEIAGGQAAKFNTREDFQRFRDVVEKSLILKDLRQPVLEELARLQQADAAYLSIFKALAPCIEGLLRNICQIEGLVISNKGLGILTATFQGSQTPILRESTLEVVDAIFRPYRNIVEHGHVVPSEQARLLCELGFSTITLIHNDYQDYKHTNP